MSIVRRSAQAVISEGSEKGHNQRLVFLLTTCHVPLQLKADCKKQSQTEWESKEFQIPLWQLKTCCLWVITAQEMTGILKHCTQTCNYSFFCFLLQYVRGIKCCYFVSGKNGLIVLWKEFALYYIMLISAKTKIYFMPEEHFQHCQNLVLRLRILIPMHHVVLILIMRSKGPKYRYDYQKTWKKDGPDEIWDVQRAEK